MAEKKKPRAEERFEREAKMLQRNLEKRKKQQKELDELKAKKEQSQNGQAKN